MQTEREIIYIRTPYDDGGESNLNILDRHSMDVTRYFEQHPDDTPVAVSFTPICAIENDQFMMSAIIVERPELSAKIDDPN